MEKKNFLQQFILCFLIISFKNKNKKSKCTIHFGLTKKNLGGPFTNDFFMISMKEYIDESNIGKEVQLRAEFDSAYRQDNGVVAILLTKGIIIEKQD